MPFLLDNCYYLALDRAVIALCGCGLSSGVTGKCCLKSVCHSLGSRRLRSSDISLIKGDTAVLVRRLLIHLGFYPNVLTVPGVLTLTVFTCTTYSRFCPHSKKDSIPSELFTQLMKINIPLIFVFTCSQSQPCLLTFIFS